MEAAIAVVHKEIPTTKDLITFTNAWRKVRDNRNNYKITESMSNEGKIKVEYKEITSKKATV